MNTIYTFGDGFALGHIWPEWPQILQALMPDTQVANTAAVGAGPEWLVYKFVQILPQNSTVIFQWPQADRFDKLLEDRAWTDLANTDPVYDFNQHDGWWLSSASRMPKVREYHTEFVQRNQHIMRLATYRELVRHTLENNNCKYLFITTQEQSTYARKFTENVRLNQVQPSPIVHFKWLTEIVIPAIGLEIDQTRSSKLENLIVNQQWEPFYYDRDQLWDTLLEELNNPDT
jgi:hypothetical protein